MKYKALTLRIPEPLHKAIVKLAEAEMRSINAEILFLLTKAVGEEK